MPANRPGRSCPLHYHYGPDVFRQPASPALSDLQVLYVVGGLYGNEHALQQVLRLFAAEQGRKQLVFNGDFHWFDADAQRFACVQQAVLAHTAMRGNVETELASANSDDDAGCGCAYPDWVGDGVVERSNRILRRLRTAVTPAQQQELAALPMWLVAELAGRRIGIVHGDAQSLAGWGFAQEHLSQAAGREQARAWFQRAGVHAFACSHTCLPVFQRLQLAQPDQPRWVLNNGAAGMPNFQGDAAGLLTRIASTPCPPEVPSRASLRDGPWYVDAVAIEVDGAAVAQDFLALWPAASDAHASYFERVTQGPTYHPTQVIRLED